MERCLAGPKNSRRSIVPSSGKYDVLGSLKNWWRSTNLEETKRHKKNIIFDSLFKTKEDAGGRTPHIFLALLQIWIKNPTTTPPTRTESFVVYLFIGVKKHPCFYLTSSHMFFICLNHFTSGNKFRRQNSVIKHDSITTLQYQTHKLSLRQRGSRRELFEAIQAELIDDNQLQSPSKKPVRVHQDVKTRWDSTYHMIKWFVRLEKVIRH